MRYPEGSVINVKTQYGAMGDGVADDTAALRRAIAENIGHQAPAILFLPAGVYLISDRLEWRDTLGNFSPRLVLAGESRDSTVIRLADASAGYQDTAVPKAVLFTASEGRTSGGAADWVGLGEGNEAFQNYLFDLTVEVGLGNPGAIGIDYLASNIGAVRNVLIRALGPSLAGLALVRRWPGPCLIKNLEVEGFAYGLVGASTQYGVTLDNITLRNQEVAGILVDGQSLFMRKVFSENVVPALIQNGPGSLVVLLDGVLPGGSASVSAIRHNAGEYYFRDVTAQGYRSALSLGASPVSGLTIAEASSRSALSIFPSPPTSLGLPIGDTPEIAEDPPETWTSIGDFGGRGDDPAFDNSPALQAAIDSGATTVYLPVSSYAFSQPVILRGNLRHLHFMGSRIGVTNPNNFTELLPVFIVEAGAAPIVMIERVGSFWDLSAPTFPGALVDHASSRTLVIRHGGGGVRTLPGSGPVFLEDVGARRIELNGGRVWARQLNLESQDVETEYVLNNGGQLWILGMKTEGPNTVIRTLTAGKSELLGGFIFPELPPVAGTPAFDSVNASQSLVYLSQAYVSSPGADYDIQVREKRGPQTRTLSKSQTLPRANGSMVPLFVGYQHKAPGAVLGAALLAIGLIITVAADAGRRRLFNVPSAHPRRALRGKIGHGL